ncbi:MAG: hypothetical protein ACLQVL_03005 [Terriglobia bacterium]
MKSLVRCSISLAIVCTTLMLAIPISAQRLELNPDAFNPDTPSAQFAATYFQPAKSSAISLGGAKKRPTSSGIPSARRRHGASRGPIPSYGRQSGAGITLRIYNYSHVPPRMLRKAEEQAATIFDQSGVNTRWVDCPTSADEFVLYPDCQGPLTPEDLLVNILPAAMAVKSTASGDALGFASIPPERDCSRSASLFFDRIQEISRSADVSPELVLGPVMAHEAGHLLLGSNSHSAWGIMQAVWGSDNIQTMARSVVGFTDSQRHQLQRNVAERTSLDPCSADGVHDLP